MEFIILVIIVVIIVLYLDSGKGGKKPTEVKLELPKISIKTAASKVPAKVVASQPAQDSCQQSMHETVLDTQSRGYVPPMNQPDHIANFWKTDTSQYDGQAYGDNQDTFDVYMCTKNNAINQTMADASHMHLASRFLTLSSD